MDVQRLSRSVRSSSVTDRVVDTDAKILLGVVSAFETFCSFSVGAPDSSDACVLGQDAMEPASSKTTPNSCRHRNAEIDQVRRCSSCDFRLHVADAQQQADDCGRADHSGHPQGHRDG